MAPDDLADPASCPLCAQHLTTVEQCELATELAELRADADVAERKIEDACSDIATAIRSILPDGIEKMFDQLAIMEPTTDYKRLMKGRFIESTPFSGVLLGIGKAVEKHIAEDVAAFPKFHFSEFQLTDQEEPPPVQEIRKFIHTVKRVIALVEWWASHRGAFVRAWKELLGQANADGDFPKDSLNEKLRRLEDAISKATPLDRSAKHLQEAKKAAAGWNRIHREQQIREEIAAALEPLKNLKQLVNAESHRLISSLGRKVEKVLHDIRLKDPPYFESVDIKNRQVSVQGSFNEEYKIDAGLVANASWLRACLWAFVFAIRDAAIQEKGGCSFPLVVLDDPQLTFDPKNKRKWAQKIADIANGGQSSESELQLFLTTHEGQFFQILTDTCDLQGQKGMIARPRGNEGNAQILNGTKLERLYAEAEARQSDEKGWEYVRRVRTHCEDLLRIMLRPESYELTKNSLGALADLLIQNSSKRIAPFDRPIIKRLIESLDAKTQPAIGLMNKASHTDDGTIGLAQAQDVEEHWRKEMSKRFSEAFRLVANYDAFGGDPKLYSYPENVIDFPASSSQEISKAILVKTGVAAAAASDGRVGGGAISIEEWENSNSLKLHNHDAYRVMSPTLEPVVTVGDVVLVRNYGKPKPRDLVVSTHTDRLVARRLNMSGDHPDMAMLLGQSTDPTSLPEPIVVSLEHVLMRKIVGVVFGEGLAEDSLALGEVASIEDPVPFVSTLDGVRLLEVRGRSMEPIALEDQLVMTRQVAVSEETLARLDGNLVIAIDENEMSYFKRLRRHDNLIVLESVNSSKSTPSEVLSLDGVSRPRLTGLMSVVGVLFEVA